MRLSKEEMKIYISSIHKRDFSTLSEVDRSEPYRIGEDLDEPPTPIKIKQKKEEYK